MSTRGMRLVVGAVVVTLAVSGCSFARQVDVNAGGVGGTSSATIHELNHNGWPIFSSASPNLVPADTNGQRDVFIQQGDPSITRRVSVTDANAQISAVSAPGGLDDSGQRALFLTSGAATSGDGNGRTDVFLRDLDADTTTLVSVDSAEQPLVDSTSMVTTAAISDDGTRAAFAIQQEVHSVPGHAYVRDLDAGTTTELGVADAQYLQMSGDGLHFIVFPYVATGPAAVAQFVDPAGSPLASRTFCRGTQFAAMSPDGRYVALRQGQVELGCTAVDRPAIWDRSTDSIIPLTDVATGSQTITSADDSFRFIADPGQLRSDHADEGARPHDRDHVGRQHQSDRRARQQVEHARPDLRQRSSYRVQLGCDQHHRAERQPLRPRLHQGRGHPDADLDDPERPGARGAIRTSRSRGRGSLRAQRSSSTASRCMRSRTWTRPR